MQSVSPGSCGKRGGGVGFSGSPSDGSSLLSPTSADYTDNKYGDSASRIY